MRIAILTAAALLALAGCSSYESDVLTEGPYGQFEKTQVRGVPIVVTVPQKLGFLVTETTYEVRTPTVSADGTVGQPIVSYITESSIDRNPIPLGKSTLVGLDIKRPMFGTAKTGMDLANQYPTKLSSEVDDKTLGPILDAFGKLIEKQGTPENATGALVQKTATRQVQYLLVYDPATKRFERQQYVGT